MSAAPLDVVLFLLHLPADAMPVQQGTVRLHDLDYADSPDLVDRLSSGYQVVSHTLTPMTGAGFLLSLMLARSPQAPDSPAALVEWGAATPPPVAPPAPTEATTGADPVAPTPDVHLRRRDLTGYRLGLPVCGELDPFEVTTNHARVTCDKCRPYVIEVQE